MPGLRLGIYVFKDAEIVDFAARYGVWSVARPYDPELDAFLIADAMRPVQAQAGFTVLPNYCFEDAPSVGQASNAVGGHDARQRRRPGVVLAGRLEEVVVVKPSGGHVDDDALPLPGRLVERRVAGALRSGCDQPLMPPSIDSLCEVTIALSSAAR